MKRFSLVDKKIQEEPEGEYILFEDHKKLFEKREKTIAVQMKALLAYLGHEEEWDTND